MRFSFRPNARVRELLPEAGRAALASSDETTADGSFTTGAGSGASFGAGTGLRASALAVSVLGSSVLGSSALGASVRTSTIRWASAGTSGLASGAGCDVSVADSVGTGATGIDV